MPPGSGELTEEGMSRWCRAEKGEPLVTMYCSVPLSLFSIVGLYTSESTPPATVNHTFDPVPWAVPKQSLRELSRYAWVPGRPGALPLGTEAAELPAAEL